MPKLSDCEAHRLAYLDTFYRAGLASDAAFDGRAEELYELAAEHLRNYQNTGGKGVPEPLAPKLST